MVDGYLAMSEAGQGIVGTETSSAGSHKMLIFLGYGIF